MNLHGLTLTCLLVALGPVFLAGCDNAGGDGGGASATPTPNLPPKEVVVATANIEAWPQTVTVQGSLLADEDSVIGSKIAGRVESVAVDLGSVVKRGDPLVVLDRSDLLLQVELAEAQLSQAASAIGLTPDDDESKVVYANSPRVELEQAAIDEANAGVNRARQLLPTRAVTEAELDTLVAQLKAAQARYDSAVNAVREQISLIGVRRKELALVRQQLADAVIVAPFEGVVEERRVSPGEYVPLGQPVVTLVRADRLRFTAGVPESQARGIAVGQNLQIRVAGRDEPVMATVTRVSPTVTQTSRAVRIEADVPNADLELPAGLFAEAEIIVNPLSQALALPASAVTRFAGVQKVWLVADGQARQQTVRIGREEHGRVEILQGLNQGDHVVIDAAQGHDGPVIAVQQSTAAKMSEASPLPVAGTGGM